jgi:membrane-associated protein
MDLLHQFVDIFLHLDKQLNTLAGSLGASLYVVLFIIVFCETGLVVTPFLPGDSLLFAVGALAATDGSPVSIVWAMVVLASAAVLGDAANYSFGRIFGQRVFKSESSRLFNRKHLIRTQEFYERHGGKTIIIARFIPIIRTFAPFVAGIGKMRYTRFASYNVVGALVWVVGISLAGYRFGRLEFVKKNFEVVVLAIIALSVMPIVVEYIRARRRLPEPTPKAAGGAG